jgi:hypothetical protein
MQDIPESFQLVYSRQLPISRLYQRKSQPETISSQIWTITPDAMLTNATIRYPDANIPDDFLQDTPCFFYRLFNDNYYQPLSPYPDENPSDDPSYESNRFKFVKFMKWCEKHCVTENHFVHDPSSFRYKGGKTRNKPTKKKRCNKPCNKPCNKRCNKRNHKNKKTKSRFQRQR